MQVAARSLAFIRCRSHGSAKSATPPDLTEGAYLITILTVHLRRCDSVFPRLDSYKPGGGSPHRVHRRWSRGRELLLMALRRIGKSWVLYALLPATLGAGIGGCDYNFAAHVHLVSRAYCTA